jgi:hypothetical protein
MCYRLLAAVLFTVLLQQGAGASGVPAFPFVDGLWQGDIRTAPGSGAFEECWASTTYDDLTTLTLSERKDGTWQLQLSNPGWRLPQSHRYVMTALVDFYPRLRIEAETMSETRLEFADINSIPLLRFIEIGHTIDLTSDGFNAKYDLEGSAKVIERLRDCFTANARAG